jgi:hypothetical protein
MAVKKYLTCPAEKYNKTYISKHPKVLFVLDCNNPPHRPLDYFHPGTLVPNLNNVYCISFSQLINDNDIEGNKRVIKNELQKLKEKAKKFKQVNIPDIPLGQTLANRARQTFKIFSNKWDKLTLKVGEQHKILIKMAEKKRKKDLRRSRGRTNNNNNVNNSDYYNHDDNNNDNVAPSSGRSGFLFFGTSSRSSSRTSKKKKTVSKKKKLTKKELKKIESKSRKAIQEDLPLAKAECSMCNEAFDLSKQSLHQDDNADSQNYISELEDAVKVCKDCMSTCKNISKNMVKIKSKKRKEKFEARFPSMCKIDHQGKTKAMRIKESLDSTLISQIRLLGL